MNTPYPPLRTGAGASHDTKDAWLWRGREVEPERKPVRQRAVDGKQRLTPGEVVVIDVVRLVVQDHEVLEEWPTPTAQQQSGGATITIGRDDQEVGGSVFPASGCSG